MSIADLGEVMETLLRTAPELAPYVETAGCHACVHRERRRQSGGGSRQAATAILAAVDAGEPRLRLALGVDAVEAIRAKRG